MRPIGFSTGAITLGDFRTGLEWTRAAGCSAVEISALRLSELFPLLDSLDSIELQGFQHVSIHAPSQFETGWEAAVGERLHGELFRG